MGGYVRRTDERSPTVRPSSPTVEHRCFGADNRHNGAKRPVAGNARAGRPTAVVRALCPACHLVRNPGDSWPHDGRDAVDPLRDPSSSRPNETAAVRTFERRMYVRGGLAPEIASSAVYPFLDAFPDHLINESAFLLRLLQRKEIPLRCGPSIRPFLAPSRSISRRSRVHFERISPWHHLSPSPDFSSGGCAWPSGACSRRVGDDGHSPPGLGFPPFVLHSIRLTHLLRIPVIQLQISHPTPPPFSPVLPCPDEDRILCANCLPRPPWVGSLLQRWLRLRRKRRRTSLSAILVANSSIGIVVRSRRRGARANCDDQPTFAIGI